jgi:hypothetical protein
MTFAPPAPRFSEDELSHGPYGRDEGADDSRSSWVTAKVAGALVISAAVQLLMWMNKYQPAEPLTGHNATEDVCWR